MNGWEKRPWRLASMVTFEVWLLLLVSLKSFLKGQEMEIMLLCKSDHFPWFTSLMCSFYKSYFQISIFWQEKVLSWCSTLFQIRCVLHYRLKEVLQGWLHRLSPEHLNYDEKGSVVLEISVFVNCGIRLTCARIDNTIKWDTKCCIGVATM